MQKQRTHRQNAALLLHLLMVTGVVLNLLYGCWDSLAIQWNRFEQHRTIRQLPERSSLLVVLQVSGPDFSRIQRVNEDECVIDGQYYDIVSIIHAPEGITLTLLPDTKETSLRKSIRQKMADASPFNMIGKWPPMGFWFFETWEMPVSHGVLADNAQRMTFIRYSPNPMLSINLPPPKSSRVG